MPAEKEVVNVFWKSFENHDLDACEALLAPDATITFDGQDHDVSGYRAIGQMFLDAFPDMKITLLNQIQEGDTVVSYVSFTGTQQGELMGIPPTGRRVNLTGVDIDTVQNGKIARRVEISNRVEMLQQLGVMPAPEGAPA